MGISLIAGIAIPAMVIGIPVYVGRKVSVRGTGVWGVLCAQQKFRADRKGGSCHRTQIQLSLLKLLLSPGFSVGRGKVVPDSPASPSSPAKCILYFSCASALTQEHPGVPFEPISPALVVATFSFCSVQRSVFKMKFCSWQGCKITS